MPLSSFNLDGNVFIALLYFSSLQYSTQNQFIFLVGEIIYFPSLTQCVSKDRTSEREREREIGEDMSLAQGYILYNLCRRDATLRGHPLMGEWCVDQQMIHNASPSPN